MSESAGGERLSQETRSEKAEKVLQAVERWRAKWKPSCAESCWQNDNCSIEAPQLVQECMDIAGYYDGD